MTKRENDYFEALVKDREESATVLEKRSMRGVKTSVVEKYSDQAHFIYELLQNADDAGATSAHFVLKKDKLIFSHNGSKRFCVTDPSCEDEDSENGRLGDINAITSIANSNKTESSIGKFGVGFKAVFQYTTTPSIYDPNVFFKIERFIVPKRVEQDYPGRNAEDTLFVFPFDHPDRTAPEAYEDIFNKLSSLIFPTLFLHNLKSVSYECNSGKGMYKEKIEQHFVVNNTVTELISLSNTLTKEEERIWLFSRTDDSLTYSVGFFLDNDGKLTGKDYSAFCFFPTKETTGLHFIIHAPFLLTDSRESIQASKAHNTKMIQLLAELSADSLVLLRDIGKEQGYRYIDDNIFAVIPYDEGRFVSPRKDTISFYPFYEEVKKAFGRHELLPGKTKCVPAKNACWAEDTQIASIYSDRQLSDLLDSDECHWVFTSIRRYYNNSDIPKYICGIVSRQLDDNDLLSSITSEFIQKQSKAWLSRFYHYISSNEDRVEFCRDLPIFIDSNGNAVAAYDENDQAILFLPIEGASNYEGLITIDAEMLGDKSLQKIVKHLEIKKPSLRDEIYNMILPLYETDGELDTDPHFLKFFQYYKECPHEEVDGFLDLIRDKEFIGFHSADDEGSYRGIGNELYFPTETLKKYFSHKPDTKFVDYDEYLELVGHSDSAAADLNPFLSELGVSAVPRVMTRYLSIEEAREKGLPIPYSTRERYWEESYIDGCENIISDIKKRRDEKASLLLWEVLLEITKNSDTYLNRLIKGTCYYFYYNPASKSFTPTVENLLKDEKWLINDAGKFVAASQLTTESLNGIYPIDSSEGRELLDFLEIKDPYTTADDDNLTEEQAKQIRIARKIEKAGITEEEIDRIINERKEREALIVDAIFTGEDHESTKSDRGDKKESNHSNSRRLSSTETKVVKDILTRTPSKQLAAEKDVEQSSFDEDEYTPRSVDYQKKIEKAKDKSKAEIEEIAALEELQNLALNAEKYSFAWFKALLQLEAMNNAEGNSQSREISISFGRVEREPGTERTLILKQPSRYIPQSIEELADIPLVLQFGDQRKSVAVEVVNIQSYTLRAKLKSGAEIDGLDLSKVTEAKIDAKSPAFLLEELLNQFEQLPLEDDDNLQEKLCENIEFVFGPPGTGKTTHLAQKVLIPLMNEKEDYKVLVLTPTNKAANVLAKRILECKAASKSPCEDWLVRFGSAADESIEQSGIFREKVFDIRTLKRNVTITTIARFPYDFFMPSGDRLFLNALKWDYIIIDEASMIPLANIVFPLYKKTPKKFIIAGDPFQIEPITRVGLWKNENIYTMVKLDSFTAPKTIPHDYPVTLLTTQYRSIPAVGDIFNKFAYGGILSHHRRTSDQKRTGAEKKLGLSSLNIIRFPVSKYESIYRAKKLQNSPYQAYSALFTYEYIKYYADLVGQSCKDHFNIGVIAPYRAQADLVDKLVSSVKLPENVSVQVGTIHGFQGDECNAIFALFNPPPYISNAPEMFLNKLNIINVAVSRARDYLFVIMPDDDTENIHNLRLVNQIEKLCLESGDCSEFNANELEKKIFGNDHYLEENSFSTGHQPVNVYGLPEQRYEIRSEDSAIDIQIHDKTKG